MEINNFNIRAISGKLRKSFNLTLSFAALFFLIATYACGGAEPEPVPSTIPVESIYLNKTEVTLTKDEEIELTAVVTPANATDKTVVWSSDNPNVASVENGRIRANNVGEAMITAASGAASALCRVTVKPISISFTESALSMNVGDKLNLKDLLSPKEIPAAGLLWSSSAPDIVSVSAGEVIAKKIGKATISVSLNGGNPAYLLIDVSIIPPTGGSEGTGEVEW